MELIKQYKISSNSDLMFAKRDLKNLFEETQFIDSSFFLFALMELGTNILKYPKRGEIWILKEESDFLIAALDKGEGFKDINWALKKGTSSNKTLGLGLYQLSQNSKYKLEILSLNQKDLHGSIILLRPNKDKKVIYLIKNYLNLPYGGDFIIKKGKYIILGDVSGHGYKAFVSAEKIKEFISKRVFSCLLIEDFFKEIDAFIKLHHLRSVVLSVMEITKFGIEVCGIGSNMAVVKNYEDIEIFSFKEGILGEVFSSVSKYKFSSFEEVYLVSDGINVKFMYNILKESDSLYLSVIGSIYFSEDKDDRSAIGVKNGL